MQRVLALSLYLLLSATITSCSSVSEKIPTVKIERKKPKVIRQVSYAEPSVQRAEAAMVCDNANMRARAADKNMKNDTARVLILEESKRSNTILADVEVNCRDYFKTQTASVTVEPEVTDASFNIPIIPAQIAPIPSPKPTPKVEAAEGYFYSVRKGDTLYQIARENCSSVKAIARLNDIDDPTLIDRGQILRLPASKCDKK